MNFNLPIALQGLGATLMAFADPRQSLMLSQGIHQRNAALEERKERERRQTRQLQLQEEKFAFQQNQAQQQQDIMAAQRQQLANMMAMGAAPGVSGIPPSLEFAIQMQSQTDPTAAAKMYSDYRLAEIARQRKAAEPHEVTQRARAAAALTPAELRGWQSLTSPTNIEVNLADQAQRAPGRFHPVFGPSGDRKAWAIDQDTGEYITRRVDAGGGVMVDMPVLIDTEQGTLGSEATQRAGLVATGNQNIKQMRDILAARDEPWDPIQRAQYFGNVPGTSGSELYRHHFDAIDALVKLRTGAAATDVELDSYFKVFGFSSLHNAEGVEKRLNHLENSIDVYRRTRERLGLEENEPIPPSETVDADNKIKNDPKVNPYAIPGTKFLRHHPDGKGAIYEIDGREYFKPYTSMQ